MASEANTTTDHDFIRKWAEERGGRPAVKNTASGADAGELRIDFPGYGDEHSLNAITWDQFFQKFDEKQLAFLYQDKTAAGAESRFCKFIARAPADARAHDHKHGGDHPHQERVQKPH
jgi:hypothetical protein